MPFRFPFMPYNYNNYPYRRPINYYPNNYTSANPSFAQNGSANFGQNSNKFNEGKMQEKHPENSEGDRASEDSECFFELFGLRLHFDDVLIICILFFLYNEEVHDYELFLSLILLLIS